MKYSGLGEERMDEEKKRRLRKRVRIALVLFPFVIAIPVLGGLYSGFYLTTLLNEPSRILYPLSLSTLGLGVSIVIIYFLSRKVTSV